MNVDPRAARGDYPRARRILVEDKANGSAVIEMLQDELDGIIAIEPEGGKEAARRACEPQIEAGNFYLPDGAPWIDSFVEEFALFPNGKAR
jgi:predicted phage terminase large subunit-like protein